jgi:hypothetical protein
VVGPVFYARPKAVGRVLGLAPAVASWDAAGSRGQARSAAFIDDVCAAVGEQVSSTTGPLALRLHIGLADTAPLYALHDLDNYLFPLVPGRTGREFVSVWATKHHAAASSSVAAGPAVAVDDPRGLYAFEVTTTASASTSGYKEQIRDQIAAASLLPGEGVALQLAFVVGPAGPGRTCGSRRSTGWARSSAATTARGVERPGRAHHRPRPALRRRPRGRQRDQDRDPRVAGRCDLTYDPDTLRRPARAGRRCRPAAAAGSP